MNFIFIFLSSMLAASVILMFKAFELSTSKKSLILALICKIDRKLNKLAAGLNLKIFQIIQSLRYVLFIRTREFMRSFTLRLQESAKNEYRMLESQILGRRVMSSRGSASFFLKKISEGRESIGHGRIEENLLD